MDKQQNNNQQNTENLKEIPKWARKYAQNRTLPNLIGLVIFICLFAGIAIPARFGSIAHRNGNMLLHWTCHFVSIVSVISLLIFSVPKWGGKFITRISERLYRREGTISISEPESMKKKWLGYVAGMIFVSCIIGSIILGSKGLLPIKYMQPISALYIVPFTLFLYFWQQPKVSPITLLWPILYTVHAILIVSGAPILFTGNLTSWNMRLPLFGYGLLTYIISHLYSRHALKNLKDISHLEGDTANDV